MSICDTAIQAIHRFLRVYIIYRNKKQLYRCIAGIWYSSESLPFCVNSSRISTSKVWNALFEQKTKELIYLWLELNEAKITSTSQCLVLSPLVAITADIRFGRVVLSMRSIGLPRIVLFTHAAYPCFFFYSAFLCLFMQRAKNISTIFLVNGW